MTKILLSNPDKLHKIRQKQYKTNQTYRSSFLDKKTKYYKKKFTTSRNCPVCNHKDSIILFKKDGGVFVKCKKSCIFGCWNIFIGSSFNVTKVKELLLF